MKNILNTILILTIILPVSVFAHSCKSQKDTIVINEQTTPSAEGTWVLDIFQGKPATESFKGKMPFMKLDFSDYNISGNSGCNNYSGTFILEKDVLTAGQMASTMMLCMDDNMEDLYLHMFDGSKKITVSESSLSIMDNDQEIARFVRGIDMANLINRKWVLKSINGKDAASVFNKGNVPFLEINANENRISGNAGCNSFNSNFNIQGLNIEISPAMMTRMACPNMDAESTFINEILGISTLKLTGDSFIFVKNGKEVLEFTAQLDKK